MNQGSHTVEQGMHRTWQHFPKCLTAHLLDRYSIVIRFKIEQQSKNNRTTNEKQSLQPHVKQLSDTCQ